MNILQLFTPTNSRLTYKARGANIFVRNMIVT